MGSAGCSGAVLEEFDGFANVMVTDDFRITLHDLAML